MLNNGDKLVAFAKKFNRMHEVTNNSQLKSFLGLNPAKIPWCARFINKLLEGLGIKGTGSDLARSLLKLEAGKKVEYPRRGDIVVYRRGMSSWQGHVGIFLKETPTHILTLGGNQGNSVCSKLYRKSKLLGFIRI